MKNKIAIPTILFILVLVFSFFAFSKEKDKEELLKTESVQEETNIENEIILFYGDGCPHCAIVDEYLEENNVGEQIKFSHKEVYNIPTNDKQLEEKAKACGMATDSIGVPFLWDGEKCFVGDQDIINFFKEKIIK